MSSELHELIQKEIAAAEQRIDQAGSYGYQRGSLRIETPGRRSRSGFCDNACTDALWNWWPAQMLWLRWEALSRGKKIAVFVVLVCFIMIISIATAPADDQRDTFGTKDTTPGTLHYLKIHQGLDPEALPSLAIIGVAKAGVTDLFRRLQLRYPSLHGGQYKDTNFLLECYMNETMLSDWRDDHPHCNKVNAADPKCYLCTPQGYFQMFNTSDVRKSLGACTFPLQQQLACAGGPQLPNSKTRAAAASYTPTFTVDASQSYSASVGQALRSADMLRQLSPTTRAVMLLRNPLDIGRAIYNQLLWDKCGTEECGKDVPPFQAVVDLEMQFLNQSAVARKLVERLANSTHPGEARLLEINLQTNWTAWMDKKGPSFAKYEYVFNKNLFTLKGLYQPTWLDRFVVPGRPLLVMQAEGYLANAPQYVDDVLGPFLFGDPSGLASFQKGPPPLPVEYREVGNKATQTVASRCALFDTLYKPLNAQLERMLTEGVKQGKVLLVRAQKEGPLWPRPANCKPDGSTPAGANYTAIQQDYDYEAMPSSEQLAADYSYYFEGGEDYSDYETGAAPGAPAPPPGGKKLIVFKAGRRSLVE